MWCVGTASQKKSSTFHLFYHTIIRIWDITKPISVLNKISRNRNEQCIMIKSFKLSTQMINSFLWINLNIISHLLYHKVYQRSSCSLLLDLYKISLFLRYSWKFSSLSSYQKRIISRHLRIHIFFSKYPQSYSCQLDNHVHKMKYPCTYLSQLYYIQDWRNQITPERLCNHIISLLWQKIALLFLFMKEKLVFIHLRHVVIWSWLVLSAPYLELSKLPCLMTVNITAKVIQPFIFRLGPRNHNKIISLSLQSVASV